MKFGTVPSHEIRISSPKLALAIEMIAFGLVGLAPWAFFCVPPAFESVLRAGVFIILALWAARMVIEGRPVWTNCPAFYCLAALVLWCNLQLVPLPNLASISPNTVRLYEQFLSPNSEVLPFGIDRIKPPSMPGSTLSVYPENTRFEMVRLLALVCLFAAALCNLSLAGSLRRLSILAMINGAALALFGLLQYYSSPHDTIYWSMQFKGNNYFLTAGRNHTPFYLNICLGLSVGLLCWRRASTRVKDRLNQEPQIIVRDTVLLSIMFGVVLMCVAVFVSQSRGAFVAMIGGALVSLLLYATYTRPRLSQIGAFAFCLLAIVFVLGWLQFDWSSSRVMRNLFTGDPLADGRVVIWKRVLSFVRDFPIFGTGLGTIGFVEPLNRELELEKYVGKTFIFTGHAYNEFLEALAEGGVIRLLLTLLFIWFIARCGYRAYGRHVGTPKGGLIMGAIFAFATIIIHSWFDLGIHLPANAFMAALVAAILALEGNSSAEHCEILESRSVWADMTRLASWARFAAILAASGALVVTGGFIFQFAMGCVQAQAFLATAREIAGDSPSPQASYEGARSEILSRADRMYQITQLEEAVRLWPQNAWVHLELAEANMLLFKEQSELSLQKNQTRMAAEAVVGLAPQPVLTSAPLLVALSVFEEQRMRKDSNALSRDYLAVALQRYLLARDLCPLCAPAHVRLATYWEYLENKEPRRVYIARAKRLLAADAGFWYFCGVQEITDGRKDEACQSWRHSLELAATYYPLILAKGRALLARSEFMADVLPNNPKLIYQAARELYPETEATLQAKQTIEKRLDEIRKKPASSLSANDWHTQAILASSLERWDSAFASYEEALDRNSAQIDWRLEYANLLHQRGLIGAAQKQALIILQYEPRNVEARRILRLDR